MTEITVAGTGEAVDELSREFVRRPSDQALKRAERAAKAASWRDAVIRRAFVNRTHLKDDSPPALAFLLRHGGGLDAVRLKLYLSMLWMGARLESHRFDYPARAWAELLDLPDLDKGTRRVRDAITFLADRGLVAVKRIAGRDPRVTLRREDGTGSRYTNPAETKEGRYLSLPHRFWTQGWLSALSGRAIASYLVLLDAQTMGQSDALIWVASSRLGGDYDISADSWQAGIRELAAQGLIRRRIDYVETGEGFGDIKKLPSFRLDRERVNQPPSSLHWSPKLSSSRQ